MLSALLQVAGRNIGKQLRYSLGAFLAVVAGFLSLTLFRAYMVDVAYMYEESFQHRGMFGHLLVEKKGPEGDPWERLLTAGDQRFIDDWLKRHAAQVKESVRFLVGSGMISNGTSSTVFWARGIELGSGARLRGETWEWDAAFGKPIHLATDVDTPLGIGKSLAAIFECEWKVTRPTYSRFGGYTPEERPFSCPERRLQLSATTPNGQSNALEGTLVAITDGIFKEVDSKLVVLPLPAMQRLYDTDGITRLSLELNDGVAVSPFRDSLERDAQAAGIPLYVTRWQEHREGDLYMRTMSLLGIFRNFVVAIMIAIAGLSVFNTFLKVVHERTREIGTLRSLGFRRLEVTTIFVAEALFLAVGGIVFGSLLALAISWGVNLAGIPYKAGVLSEPVPFRIAYDLGIYLTSAFFLVAVATLAALNAVTATVRRPITENLVHA